MIDAPHTGCNHKVRETSLRDPYGGDPRFYPQERPASRPTVWLVAAAIAGGLPACSGDPPGIGDPAPVITVTGITDGETRAGPVTITIAVDVGTYQATLNGESFFSGRTVRDPGDYLLTVTARNGDAVSTAAIAFTLTLAGDTRLIIRVLDLGSNEAGGGGDAILLTDSSGAGQRHMLVDAGPAGPDGNDPGFVARRLAALGVDTLAALLLTHAHSDHFGGMEHVLGQIVVRRFIYNGQVRNVTGYTAVITSARTRADTAIVPDELTTLTVGFGSRATDVAIVPPLATFLDNANATSSELNEGSLGAEVTKGSFRMFLAADGEIQAHLRWRTGFGVRTGNLTILKVGHHGGNDAVFDNGFSGTSAWLEHTAPAVAVISANGVTHPRRNATALLVGRADTRTYCTPVHGEIEIRVAETGTYQVRVARNAEAVCTPGSEADT